MALTQEDLQAIQALLAAEREQTSHMMDEKLAPVIQQQKVHNESILKLENNVMHQLELISENIPNALARSEKLEEVSATVDDHDNRIFALEQKVSNG